MNINLEDVALKDALVNARDLPWTHSLYLPSQRPWLLDTRGALFDGRLMKPDEEAPEAAIARGLEYALGVHALQDLVAMAEEQLGDPTPEQLLEAFTYYFEHDAFKDFGSSLPTTPGGG